MVVFFKQEIHRTDDHLRACSVTVFLYLPFHLSCSPNCITVSRDCSLIWDICMTVLWFYCYHLVNHTWSSRIYVLPFLFFYFLTKPYILNPQFFYGLTFAILSCDSKAMKTLLGLKGFSAVALKKEN